MSNLTITVTTELNIDPVPVDWQDRAVFTQYNRDDKLIVRTYGKSSKELLQDHLDGKCDMFCEYCYQEAMQSLKEEKTMDCHECPDYQTSACISCPYPKLKEPDGHTCPVCGGYMEGDDYTIPRHCENVDYPMDAEPDSGPYYCEVPDGIYGDGEDIPF